MCVLVVEDDALVRTILMEELFEGGFEAEEASTGDQAATKLDDLAQTICAVMTDIDMPGAIDGITLAEMVRTRHPRLPVIFTTGRPDALLRAGSRGESQFLIRKPYGPEDVLARIRVVDPS